MALESTSFTQQRLDSLSNLDTKIVSLLSTLSDILLTVHQGKQIDTRQGVTSDALVTTRKEFTTQIQHFYATLSDTTIGLNKEIKLFNENIGSCKNGDNMMLLPVNIEIKNTKLGKVKMREEVSRLDSVLGKTYDEVTEEPAPIDVKVEGLDSVKEEVSVLSQNGVAPEVSPGAVTDVKPEPLEAKIKSEIETPGFERAEEQIDSEADLFGDDDSVETPKGVDQVDEPANLGTVNQESVNHESVDQESVNQESVNQESVIQEPVTIDSVIFDGALTLDDGLTLDDALTLGSAATLEELTDPLKTEESILPVQASELPSDPQVEELTAELALGDFPTPQLDFNDGIMSIDIDEFGGASDEDVSMVDVV
ncbi:hypothetical protein BABINDRAFT_159311 [Babjeviella inositovora NRRL Y-12698]|uniref:Mediator of RNA polymerase II transcription subunit 11 n=1 Tax=Babjeviella inositovora NRRL Y-12698 TaxID=984486 RepID=A0A1E3QYQ9_9ASCO|nr:uncharacterized protein BABINDRAFT_159311 [Babjeviella inositovora NRRL Y-12698]ODQ82810.1 hypothetical protein BABINDRAFT_159311 [Babjeviella inositovora NRRL Y-12698]